MSSRPSGGNGRRAQPPDEPYQVGYCMPPLHSRFKPGQSGNTRGRPKGPKSLEQVLRHALERRVPDPRGGGHMITMLELIAESLVVGAAKGDTRKIRLLIALLDSFRDSEAGEANCQELDATDREILEQYIASLEADQAGNEEP
jgi:hypothetical protein